MCYNIIVKKFKLKKFSIATWQLILILLPLLFLTATFLRLDHIRMTELRSDVFAADESGDKNAIDSSLVALQTFVSSNVIVNITEKNGLETISFGTGPFYLEHSYQRDANAAIEAAEKKLNSGENEHGNIFIAASDTCKPIAIANGWAWNSPGYIECMTTEINKYPAAADIVDSLTADVPSTELYRREYGSPLWAPTLSGFSILLCLILTVVIITRFFIWLIIRLSLLFIK